MSRIIPSLLALFVATELAYAQDFSEFRASPQYLARFVDTHQGFDWAAIWKSLGVTESEIFLPQCEENITGKAPCSSELISIPDPLQIIVILKHEASAFQVLLRYAPDGAGTWRFSSAYRPNVKYFSPEHRIVNIGGNPFFVVTEQGTSGSGVSSAIESWFDLTREGFHSSLWFPSRGTYYPTPEGIARITSGAVVATATKPVESITVEFKVNFMIFDPPNNTDLGSRRDLVVYKMNRTGEFEMSKNLSTVRTSEIQEFYAIEEAPWNDADFLKFDFKGLAALAASKGTKGRKWLAGFLQTAPDTTESRRLKAWMKSN